LESILVIYTISAKLAQEKTPGKAAPKSSGSEEFQEHMKRVRGVYYIKTRGFQPAQKRMKE
jgi:hypothetical protein